jgi:hypothetical protein
MEGLQVIQGLQEIEQRVLVALLVVLAQVVQGAVPQVDTW